MIAANTFFRVLLITLFFLFISVPPVAFFFQDQKKISMVEKRALAPRPSLPANVQSLLEFPASFEEYYNDHFGFRDALLDLYALGKRVIGDTLGVNISESGTLTKNVIKGKDGWYFMNRVWDGDPLSDYRNINLYSQSQLLRAGIGFAARKFWLEKQGIHYLLFIAPNKHTVYSEYLPDYLVKQGDVSSMDQLYGFLAQYTSVQFVDLREVLSRSKPAAGDYWKGNKDEARLHWKTDSHWNSAGADVAQYEVARKMAQMLPGKIEPRQRAKKDFKMVPITGDLASLMNDKALFGEKGPVIFTGSCSPATRKDFEQRSHITSCSEGKVNALIYHDSFFTALKPFFADYFATTVFLWEQLNQNSLEKNIQAYKPALVIEEFAERFLPYIPDINGEVYEQFWSGIFNRSKEEVYALDGRKVGKGKQGRDNFNAAVTYNRSKDILVIKALNQDPHIYLPEMPFDPGKLHVLKIVLDAPAKTQLQLFFSRSGDEAAFPSENDSVKYHLQKGTNTLFIPLLADGLGPRMRLDPGKKEGAYRIREFEIRTVEKTSLK